MRRRRAFTLVELLVVVGVISLLVAIALPAVVAARRALRRSECGNRLHQIGIALHSYQESHGVWPFGVGPCTPRFSADQCDQWTAWSAHAMLLPHLGAAGLYDLINFNWGTYAAPEDTAWKVNSTAMRAPVSGFLCPADVSPHAVAIGTNRSFNRGSMNNYMGSAGPDMIWIQASGLFYRFSAVRPAEVADGLANTVAFSESLRGDQDRQLLSRTDVIAGQPWPGGGSGDTWTADNHVPRNAGLVATYIQRCDAAAAASVSGDFNMSVTGMMWSWGAMGQTLFNTVLTPNAHHFDCSRNCSVCMAEWDGFHTARSNHSGGVNVLFADGAVRMISDTIEDRVWWSLGTRRGADTTANF